MSGQVRGQSLRSELLSKFTKFKFPLRVLSGSKSSFC